MLNSMTSEELTDWVAYERIAGTLGPERDDLLAGIIAERVTTMGQQSKKPKKFKVEDFLPKWGKDRKKKEKQTPEQQKSILQSLTQKFGGTRK